MPFYRQIHHRAGRRNQATAVELTPTLWIELGGDDAVTVTVRKNSGADVGTRPRLNFIEGANVTLTVLDDAGGNEVDITIAAAATSPGGLTTQIQFNDAGSFGGSSTLTFDKTAGAELLSFVGGAASGFVVNVGTGDVTLNTSGAGTVSMLTAGGNIDIDALTGTLILSGDPVEITSGTDVQVIGTAGEILLDAADGVRVDTRTGTPTTMAGFTSTGVLCDAALPGLFEARLSLAPNHPIYNPQPATPSATDTGTEVITFAAAHGWDTGTLATVSATGGNLTTGTIYYLRALSTTTISVHTTLADALADASRVNLSASITAEFWPYGIQNTTLYLLPYKGNRISVYSSGAWKVMTLPDAGISLALSMTSGDQDDFFVYDNAGTLTLEHGADWTSATVRSAALGFRDGVEVLGSDHSRRLAGTGRAVGTNTLEDSAGGVITLVGAKRFLGNRYHLVPRPLAMFYGGAGTYTYSTVAYRQWNAQAGARVEMVACVEGVTFEILLAHLFHNDNATAQPAWLAVGLDSTTVNMLGTANDLQYSASSALRGIFSKGAGSLSPGYHALNALEIAGSTTGTYTWYQSNAGSPRGTTARLTGLTGWGLA